MREGGRESAPSMQRYRGELVFPSLDKYSDLKVALFKHGVSNSRALAGTIKMGKLLGGLFTSLF